MNLTRALPGLDSYRGRYLYLTAFVLILISLFTYINWSAIYSSNQASHQNIVNRNVTTSNLNSIVSQFQSIQVQLYKYSLQPEPSREVHLVASVTRLMQLTSMMNISIFDEIDVFKMNNFIIQIPTKLHGLTINLIALRNNSEEWIPVTKIMQQQLLPLNQKVVTTLDSMLMDDQISNPLNVQSSEIRNNIHHIKVTWISIISEFRIIITNRMGVFNASSKGLNERLEKMDLLIQELNQDLDILKINLNAGDFNFIALDLLPLLGNDIQIWLDLHKQVINQLLQTYWRKDLLALEQIDLLLNEFNETSVILRNEIVRQSNNDIQQLNEIQGLHAFFFILLCILGLILAILSYVFFDRNILLPIANTTHALLQQSTGVSQELSIKSKASESRELIEAFNQMSSKIKQRELRLDYIAHHDTLTMLPNRLMFNERLQHALNLTKRSEKLVILMLLDLDRFKLVNDTLGHLFGDKLLKETAVRLKKCMRSHDTIARLGGDEFAVILENISSAQEVDKLAYKIKHIFNKPFNIDGQQIHASTSIGISVAPDNTTDPTTLIRFADIAMYQSKNQGRNQYTWFTNDLEIADESIINFENQLREAITQNQFELHYQPIINHADKNYIGCEALLRWRHPERGLIHPENFLSSLDNSTILFDLTCWVIRESAKFQTKVEKKTGFMPCISFNLATVIFQQPHYRDKIEHLLQNEIKHPSRITLEVTESTLTSDITNISATLNFLQHQGFNIALDGFGSGQSSLSHLRTFPINIIKIDQEFVRDVILDEDDANLVSAIISLAHNMNLQVIAEGVENQQQYEFLSERGCHLMQGNWIAEAMQAKEFYTFLRDHPPVS
mgnify:FL=1